jgi:hypothetical protein
MEGGRIFLFEHAFLRAHAKHDFLTAAKRSGLGGNSGPREFQPVPAEGDLSRGRHGHVAFRKQAQYPLNRIGEPIEGCSFFWTTCQAGRDVSAISEVDLDEFVVSFIEFVQVPHGCARMQAGQAFASER